jgi:outer membrane immunogenic protein
MKTKDDLRDERMRARRRAAIFAFVLALAAVTILPGPRTAGRKNEIAASGPRTNEPSLPGQGVRSEPLPPLALPADEAGAGLRDEDLRDAVRDKNPWAIPDPDGGDGTPPYDVALTTWSAPHRWTGFYVGVNAGAALGRSSLLSSVDSGSQANYFLPPDVAQIDGIGRQSGRPTGFTGGVQAGYNYQADSVVYGLEADFDAFDLSDSRTFSAPFNSNPATSFTLNQSVRTDWLFTLRPRIGLATDHFLLYATGGLAVTRLKYHEEYVDNFNPGSETGSFAKTKLGWTAGAGMEWALGNHWTLKGEYLFTDFNSATENSILAVPAGRNDQFDHSVSLTAHVVRLGLNYKF